MNEQEKRKTLEVIKGFSRHTLMETLDIEFVDVGRDYLKAKMPVINATRQPEGILHGGATAALAETAGSMAAYILSGGKGIAYRGIELSINHIKGVCSGNVYATAVPIHKGSTTQLWEVSIRDDENNLISIAKLTTIALPN
ncbi:proofreading thioesterase EntH [Elysia marginata]|uniref:Proofreading thioesterase EntH n=1 Tax=Elysia marginata TaxID=1093978 RepID=A0AAV4GS13_9GAST|nr:proofreading thioesterase EntH [Elysia marginata]